MPCCRGACISCRRTLLCVRRLPLSDVRIAGTYADETRSLLDVGRLSEAATLLTTALKVAPDSRLLHDLHDKLASVQAEQRRKAAISAQEQVILSELSNDPSATSSGKLLGAVIDLAQNAPESVVLAQLRMELSKRLAARLPEDPTADQVARIDALEKDFQKVLAALGMTESIAALSAARERAQAHIDEIANRITRSIDDGNLYSTSGNDAMHQLAELRTLAPNDTRNDVYATQISERYISILDGLVKDQNWERAYAIADEALLHDPVRNNAAKIRTLVSLARDQQRQHADQLASAREDEIKQARILRLAAARTNVSRDVSAIRSIDDARRIVAHLTQMDSGPE